MDLIQAMQAATEDPPPSSIDVDDLITRERRRSRNIDRVLGAGIAAALVVAALAVPRYGNNASTGEGPPGAVAAPQTASSLRPTRRPSGPVNPASPRVGASNPEDDLPPCERPMISVPSGPARSMSPGPTVPGVKSCEVLVPRLQQAFDTAVRRELTNMQVTNLDGSPLPSNVRRNWYATELYRTMLAVGTSGGWLQIEVGPSPSRNPSVICVNGATAPTGKGCASDDLICPTDAMPAGDTCSVTTVNGVAVRVYGRASSPGGFSVEAIHPDGTEVQLGTNGTSPATKEQLIGIAVDKAISIY